MIYSMFFHYLRLRELHFLRWRRISQCHVHLLRNRLRYRSLMPCDANVLLLWECMLREYPAKDKSKKNIIIENLFSIEFCSYTLKLISRTKFSLMYLVELPLAYAVCTSPRLSCKPLSWSNSFKYPATRNITNT